MAVRVGHVRAKYGGIKKRARRLLASVKLEPFSGVLEHASEKRFSRTTARAIEYQNPSTRLPARFRQPSISLHRVNGYGRGNSLSPQPRIRGNKPPDRALETLVRMGSIQKPRSLSMSRVLNGLAPSWPTSVSKTPFEGLW